MRRLRSVFAWLVSLLVLVGVVWWLASKPVVRFSLGPASELIAEPGIDAFLLQLPDGSWKLHTSASRSASDGGALPAGLIGRPALQSNGSVIALTPDGLLWVRAGTLLVPGGEQALLCPHDVLPDDARLEGTIGGKDALLSSATGGSRRLFICPGSPFLKPALYPVMDRDGPALVPQDATLITARAVRALAFLGERGWEAWKLSDTGLATRFIAEGCSKAGAIFTPDGLSLIVPGRVDGIWCLSLEDGKNNLMSDGNLGISRRVPQSWGFRRDPLRLVTPQWDLDGWLQIMHHHVSGGGKIGFTMGGLHHYGVALSADGSRLAYVQAGFSEQDEEPFMEDLYLFDFDRGDSGAEQIDSRRGGAPGQGPSFLGDGSALVYLSGGEAIRIDFHTQTSTTPTQN